jgi:hypothetical protein
LHFFTRPPAVIAVTLHLPRSVPGWLHLVI